MNFDLNVSILLKEHSFLDRFDQAARLNFEVVEFSWPIGEDLRKVVGRIQDVGLKVALFNFFAGDVSNGERGLLNDPERSKQFRDNVPIALEFANKIGCKTINTLVGKWLPNEEQATQLERVRENVRWAAEQAQSAGITVVVEAVNTWDNGPYILPTTAETLSFLDSIAAPNLKYQYDVYHMQMMEGNISDTIRRHISRIGHIQIADAPQRHQPGTGELNFQFILQTIDECGYSGFVGLEYNPLGSTAESLSWLPVSLRKLPQPKSASGIGEQK